MREELRDAELIYEARDVIFGTPTIGSIGYGEYPFGEPIVRHADVPSLTHRIDRLVARPASMGALLQMLFFVDAYVERGGKAPHLLLPFVPGARQDRLNPEGDYLFTIKSIAKMINERNFPSVTIVDPHSEVTSALIDRSIVITPAQLLQRYGVGALPKYDAVISPDAGAEKRASQVAQLLGIPMLHGWKKRDVATGKLAGFGIEPIPGNYAHCLIVDDICDGGGTFVGLAEATKKDRWLPLYLDLYVSHGIFSKGLAGLLQHFTGIITTNSIASVRSAPYLQVIDLFPNL